MLLPRRLLWPLPLASRRSYSYFSQKPGGGSGRFFNSSKPHRTPPRSGKPPAAPNVAPTVVSTHAANEADASPNNNANTVPDHVANVDSHDETNASTSLSSPSPSSSASSPSALSSSLSASSTHFLPQSHPHPPLPSLHLHAFFSQHRPLLLLDQPISSLFRSSQSPSVIGSDIGANADPVETSSTSDNMDETGMEDPEADADTARLLARAMVVQRVQSSRDWAAVLSKLGLESEDIVVEMDSVKRKRRKKITKHKYKKRRKLQRAERRRLRK